MSDHNSPDMAPSSKEPGSKEPVTLDSPPDADFLKRRMLLKGAAAVPVVLTLRASPALASTSNCQVVEMTPTYNPNDKTWSFAANNGETGRVPWDIEGGTVHCVRTEIQADGQECPVEIVGTFNNPDPNVKVKDWQCPTGGIIIAASSGGSFTH